MTMCTNAHMQRPLSVDHLPLEMDLGAAVELVAEARQRVMAAAVRRSVVLITIGLFLSAWMADHGS